MPRFTEENRTELNRKLEYIGMDINNIPDIIKSAEPLKYQATRSF